MLTLYIVLELITTGLLIKASTQCTEGEVRLVNGYVPNEGRVEVCIGYIWGTVCDDFWDSNDAMVVCRQLGYNPHGAQFVRDGCFGRGVGPVLLANINCFPNESSLTKCQHQRLSPEQDYLCKNGGGAGVRCSVDQNNMTTSLSVTSTDRKCTALPVFPTKPDSNVVIGVLGFIIAILVVLLAVSGVALVYLLRQRILKRSSSQPADENATESGGVPLSRNERYATAPSHSTASGPQADQAASGQDAAADYSRIDPSYATINNSRREQPVAGRNQVSARLSERYEVSQAHLAAAAGGHGGVEQGETAMDYEVPLTSSHTREYSHLQH